jgi:hypothetical protein
VELLASILVPSQQILILLSGLVQDWLRSIEHDCFVNENLINQLIAGAAISIAAPAFS